MVFEKWGEEWFFLEESKDMPATLVRLGSGPCRTCGAGHWKISEDMLLLIDGRSFGIRTTVHMKGAPSFDVQFSTEEGFEDARRRTAVRLTPGPSEVVSEVEACDYDKEENNREFRRASTWSLPCIPRASHGLTRFKRAEWMTLDGTNRVEIPILGRGGSETMAIQFVEKTDIEYRGVRCRTLRFEVSFGTAGGLMSVWVSPEHGLLQFNRGPDLMKRVSPVFAQTKLAENAELGRKMAQAAREGQEARDAGEVRVRMRCAGQDSPVKATVNGREARDADLLNALLLDEIEAARHPERKVRVLIDAEASVPWKSVMEVIDQTKKSGVEDVQLVAPGPGESK